MGRLYEHLTLEERCAIGRLAPDQKSRLIKALQSKGDVVGFLGDGINDAPALKLADIGLSVDGARQVWRRPQPT